MIWTICAAVLLLTVSVPAGLLVQRKLRQTTITAGLKIDSPSGIVEERFVEIGGIEQWIGIRGENHDNPILLLIHGGPGSSYSIFTPLLRAWEKHFTIVQWDQRGSGKTFAQTGPRMTGEISMGQLARDGIEVAKYVCARLGKDRLFLLASSFGSTFGLQMARCCPNLFYAYIGTDQNVGMVRGREELHRELIQRLRAAGLTKGAKAIERIGKDPTRWTADDFTTVARWKMKSAPRGYRRTMKLLKNAVWYAPSWTLRDIRAFVAGMRFSLEQILPEASRYDAWQQGIRFGIPFFIFQGEDDVLTTPKMARAYFDDAIAPVKNMSLIVDAGHFAAFLQPEQFLQQLLSLVRPLAEPATIKRPGALN
jgi:pimeloyl-ACP methyl ester carboxylesterase